MRRPKARLLVAAGLASAALGCAVGLIGTAAWLISRASQQPPVLYLMVAITAVRAFGLGRAAFRYGERLVAHDAAFRLLADLRVRIYRGLSRRARIEGRRGDLLSRLVADVDSIQDRYLRFLIPAAAAVVVGAGVSLFLAAVLPVAGLVLAGGLLVTGVVVPWAAAEISGRADRGVAPAKGELAADIVGLLHGAPELIAADATGDRLRRVAARDRVLADAEKRSAVAAGVGAGLTTLVVGLTVVVCAVVGVRAAHSAAMSGLLLAVVVLTPLAAFEATAGMPQAVRALQRSRVAARRVADVVDAPPTIVEPVEPLPLPAGPYTLRLRGLTIAWPGCDRPALRDIDLDLTPGRRVAVVGRSGSGKTTLINALLRFVDPAAGVITLNGVDTTRLDGDAVRTVAGLCAQDAHLFDSTLRENLRLAKPEAMDSELHDVLRRARLDDWVRSLPDGLDTFVGEHGARLSGGQRQRLALARALLADFPVLLLDEPTEHLDLPTADALTRDLLAVATLLVTHRLAGLADVDEILVLERGAVVERGTWDELLLAEGAFSRLWQTEQSAEAWRTAVG